MWNKIDIQCIYCKILYLLEISTSFQSSSTLQVKTPQQMQLIRWEMKYLDIRVHCLEGGGGNWGSSATWALSPLRVCVMYMYYIGITNIEIDCSSYNNLEYLVFWRYLFSTAKVSINNLQVAENLFERLEELKDVT